MCSIEQNIKTIHQHTVTTSITFIKIQVCKLYNFKQNLLHRIQLKLSICLHAYTFLKVQARCSTDRTQKEDHHLRYYTLQDLGNISLMNHHVWLQNLTTTFLVMLTIYEQEVDISTEMIGCSFKNLLLQQQLMVIFQR